ncbi:hypothetical protein J1P26_07455 [Neobacillus sp. MM2021_6]|uniref:hypothetical protein n=1 Tax=Bacillaceae TaxID=186817 RepID=UPI00140A7366|nr:MULTISPECIES: hypothetical protein [Bacillaceae]MBO0959569.1 hypothetical protein [Neobacillus sp. MM2021_6]NHC17133.1 hypothetical protein [Bacillus sp. MM2020_4]
MADYQIGDNLYADAQGKYYRLNNGNKAFEASPFDTMSSKINSMYDAQQKNQIDQLKAQREKAVSGFNQQKKDLAPQYQSQRNQADVVNAQNVSRLRELMAANGINASGENLTTQAQLASARQDSFRDINNNEATAIRGIDQQIANENDPSREQAIMNAIAAERSSKLADAFSQSQQDIYQRYQDYRNYQMQQEQWALEKKMKELEYQKALAALNAAKTAKSRKTSTAKTSSTATAKATASKSAYTDAKAPIAPLDQYYSNPAIIAGQRTGSPYFKNPVPPAQNPNLSAWDKMKMLGM